MKSCDKDRIGKYLLKHFLQNLYLAINVDIKFHQQVKEKNVDEYKMYYIIIRINYNQIIETVVWRWGSNIDEHHLLFFFTFLCITIECSKQSQLLNSRENSVKQRIYFFFRLQFKLLFSRRKLTVVKIQIPVIPENDYLKKGENRNQLKKSRHLEPSLGDGESWIEVL